MALLPWNLDLPAERDQERTGMPSFRNVATPFRVSIKATFCGVETMTEPVTKRNFTSVIFARARNLFRVQQRDSQGASPSTSTSCPRLSVTSPVPGGVSMTSTSRSCPDVPARQSTSNNSCCTAFMTIIPRQTTGVSAGSDAGLDGSGAVFGRRNPIDMQGKPCARSGVRRLSALTTD